MLWHQPDRQFAASLKLIGNRRVMGASSSASWSAGLTRNPSISFSYKTRLRLNMIYLFLKKPQAIDSAAEFGIYELMLIFSVRRRRRQKLWTRELLDSLLYSNDEVLDWPRSALTSNSPLHNTKKISLHFTVRLKLFWGWVSLIVDLMAS